ncbi:hypothetical protein OG250_13220 [Streptomyces sp. NBC_00487]|uniref:hypothetical protein n=1 Tax=unclassified Streptomyces TaxID=2593676 RepID=UPI002E16E483|nr:MULTISPECIES: hypothetical protein [unclassified Streptomyces]
MSTASTNAVPVDTTSPYAASVFGAVLLGYPVIETDRFADGRRSGTDAIGIFPALGGTRVPDDD